MNGSRKNGLRFPWRFLLTGLFLLLGPGVPAAEEEYGFDLEEFASRPFEWGGYIELKYDYLDLNQNGLLYRLNFLQKPRSGLNRFTGTTEINGSYKLGTNVFNWLLHAEAEQDEQGWRDDGDIYEAALSMKISPSVTVDLGKKTYKWGKGYAWNPVGFIDRPKDPDNPDEALEGFIGAGLDLVKSFQGPLQTMALTTVALPVWDDVNEDFGERHNVNLAAKLYLLYRDTDIDFLWYTGNSRSTRYGVDISGNITTNFEIHGELAHIPGQQQKYLAENGEILTRTVESTTSLLGLRYLTENDITSIIEFYHNDAGYSKEEMDRFFQLAAEATAGFPAIGNPALLQKALSLSRTYSRPQSGRNYLYARISQKEPFDLLYFTPGITIIYNLDDQSFTMSPEALYTGFTNWELRMRLGILHGGHFTEYGEKQNSSKLELRVRYFF